MYQNPKTGVTTTETSCISAMPLTVSSVEHNSGIMIQPYHKAGPQNSESGEGHIDHPKKAAGHRGTSRGVILLIIP